MKILCLINEKSGAVLGCGAQVIQEAAENAAAKSGNIELEVVSGDFGALCERVKQASDADAILCAGGDGTQAAIAASLLNTDIALLPLPCGTMNLLCRDLGLPLDVDEAIAAGLASPIVSIDAGCIGDRLFLNNIVFGSYAELADAREDLREVENFDDVSFGVVEAAHALFNADPINFSVTIDGADIRQSTNTIVVSNNAVSGAENLIPYRNRLDEGELYVYLSDASNGAEFAALMADFLGGEVEASERISVQKCRECRISSSAESFSYTVDGDPVETTEPVHMKIAAGALKVFRPEVRPE
ncbi:diacylglycerol/lipid kinase family protein [Hyphococcus sp.]|uniref:diacylglycerol/lipid kinase family protein n=1 Tax=Hyphococcus sp. TaxID=2038636 RepID=UPI003CCBE807